MTPGYEPRFDHDYAWGRQGELLVGGLLDGMRSGDVRVETKRKRRRDPVIYVETEHDPGRRGAYRPSGLSVTEADFWAYVIADSEVVVFVPVHTLRSLIAQDAGRPAEERDGSCPTRGRLLSWHRLVQSAERVPA